MSHSNVEPLRKDGELMKYRNVLIGWGKRYFKLERSYLHYFDSKYAHEPLATITRGEITSVKVSDQFTNLKNVFEINQKSGIVWYCQANSPEEMVSWMQALSPIPTFINIDQYPTVPIDNNTQTHQQPPFQQRPYPSAPQMSANTPYGLLMDEAHHTAYVHQTHHDCQSHSPPPPYSAQGYIQPENHIKNNFTS